MCESSGTISVFASIDSSTETRWLMTPGATHRAPEILQRCAAVPAQSAYTGVRLRLQYLRDENSASWLSGHLPTLSTFFPINSVMLPSHQYAFLNIETASRLHWPKTRVCVIARLHVLNLNSFYVGLTKLHWMIRNRKQNSTSVGPKVSSPYKECKRMSRLYDMLDNPDKSLKSDTNLCNSLWPLTILHYHRLSPHSRIWHNHFHWIRSRSPFWLYYRSLHTRSEG